jgi:hypothetical protein
VLSEAGQELAKEYDHIDIPPIRPITTRVELFRATCPGPKAADARALAYRLYEIASQKGWAAEALIYNELAQEWPKLEELASTAGARRAMANAQASLF